MVKLTGPGLSNEASGSLANDLTFSKWKGQAYLKTKRAPKQPRSGPQVAMRSMMTFLSGAWAPLSQANKNTWASLPQTKSYSPFNAYLAENLAHYRNFLFPTQAHPATRTALLPQVLNQSATGGVRSIQIEFEVTILRDGWGVAIFLVPAAPDPSTWHTLVDTVRIPGLAIYKRTLTQLAPGTHFINLTRFTTDGRHAPVAIKIGAVVTD